MAKSRRSRKRRTYYPKPKTKRFFFLGFLVTILIGLLIYQFYLVPQKLAVEEDLTAEIKKAEQQRLVLEKENQLLKEKLAKFEEKEKQRLQLGTGKEQNNFPQLAQLVDQKLTAAGFVGSVVVVKNNKVVLEKGYGYANQALQKKNDPHTTYMIASVQKSLTAVLVMDLIEKGLLSLTTPLSEFYPTIPHSEQITIRDLLDMTSGLTLVRGNHFTSEASALDYVVKQATYQKMTKWAYSDVNYKLLAGIIEKLQGKSYQAVMQETIIDRLNLKETGFYSDFAQRSDQALAYEPTGPAKEISASQYYFEIGTGNMYMSVGDLYQFNAALTSGQLISPASYQQLRTNSPQSYTYSYAGGVYQREGFFTGHGLFNGYEPSLAMTDDGQTGIVTISNLRTPEQKIFNLTVDLFQDIKK